MQVLGKTVGAFDALLRHPHLLVQIHLAAVGLVGDTDHIGAVGEQLSVFGELVDGGQEHPAAVAPLEQLTQMRPAFHAKHRLIADIALGISELAGKLVVQIGAVGNQHNGRALERRALHQQAGKEQHGEALAAAGGTKVGTALAVALRLAVAQDILVELGGRVELRVAADDLFLLARHIREEHEVTQHLAQPVPVE